MSQSKAAKFRALASLLAAVPLTACVTWRPPKCEGYTCFRNHIVIVLGLPGSPVNLPKVHIKRGDQIVWMGFDIREDVVIKFTESNPFPNLQCRMGYVCFSGPAKGEPGIYPYDAGLRRSDRKTEDPKVIIDP